ncbi:lipocalin-like domain-containing protein [Streptomyces sp. NBC_00203]|uniref:lipocalin-like domain-containing protein n=1 Tax=Streptomyces sp. NBC_00203 TaxID=2975680 RepID=UPI00324B348A
MSVLATVSGLGLAGCSGDRTTEAAPATPSPVKSSGSALTSNGYGHTPADYERVGIKPNQVQVWEDGFRSADINDNPDAYEWWYADFIGDDGTVVVFLLETRVNDGFLPEPGEAGRKPTASLIVTEPDGTSHAVQQSYAWDQFSASTKSCDVKVGPFTLSGDLKTYQLQGEANGTGLDLTLTSLVQPFRPGTGVMFLNDTDQFQGWLCAVPSGKATGTITVNGKQSSFTAAGYHDHNWGNRPYPFFAEHWRWGRGSAGKYATVGYATYLRSDYGSAFIPAVVVDDTETGERVFSSFSPKNVTVKESAPKPPPNPAYSKDYYSSVRWDYSEGVGHPHGHQSAAGKPGPLRQRHPDTAGHPEEARDRRRLVHPLRRQRRYRPQPPRHPLLRHR